MSKSGRLKLARRRPLVKGGMEVGVRPEVESEAVGG